MTTAAAGTIAPRGLAAEAIAMRIAILALVALLGVFIAVPIAMVLSKSLQDGGGRFVGLANYARYFTTPTLVSSLWNSLWVAALSTIMVVPLAFLYAYALTRTCVRAKGLLVALAFLPLFAPSLLPAISLIYMFGNQGFLKGALLGGSVYGPTGIVMAQVLYCFPHALMILNTALSLADGRLYEAAAAMGTRPWRVFWTVTLPGVRYGLISAVFVVFTLVITDFGIAKVIGGQFNVLATDAYKHVVGQQNFAMGAVVGFVLLVPAMIAFGLERQIARRQLALLSVRAVPFAPRPSPTRDAASMLYCLLVGGVIAAVLATAVWGSFITYWPYNLALTLNNYRFEDVEPNASGPYFASLRMAALAAIAGTAIIFSGAYLIEKGRGLGGARSLAQMLAMLPMAVPGLVLGLGYLFFINAPWNPLGVLYGSILLLAINTIAHFYTTAHVTAITALKQIDAEFESVSASLKVPFYRTFARVTVPICMPALLDIAVYLFVNALTTVSAVIFLYGAVSKLASISVVHMDEAGVTAAAAAMATLIVFTALSAKLLHLVLDHLVFAKLQTWRSR